MKKKVKIIVNEHFDIMWRRCFNRDFQFKGENYISYADLEGYYIIDNIELCNKYPFYKFMVESVAVLRNFLKIHPEYEDKIKQLFNEKKMFVSFSGDNIIDSNMVSGESIVRNYLYGLEYLKDNFNYTPVGLDRNDAFGQSGQIPQIANGFGQDWVYHLVYSYPDKPYWRAIDGESTLYYEEPTGCGGGGGYYKYRPCPVCHGFKNIDCKACGNRRIDVGAMEEKRHLFKANLDKSSNELIQFIRVGGEEILPISDSVDWYNENKDKYDIEYAAFNDYYAFVKEKAKRANLAGEDEISTSAEVNPNNTGTYVSRIKTKQRVRENEALISIAETLGVVSGISGKDFNTKMVQNVWSDLHFTMFHDAITATHVDAAYDELMEIHDKVKNACNFLISEAKRNISTEKEGIITVLNTLGFATECFASVEIKGAKNINITDEVGEKVRIFSKRKTSDGVIVKFITDRINAFSSKRYRVEKVKEDSSTIDYFGEQKTSEAAAELTNVVGDNRVFEENKTITIENEFYKITSDIHGIIYVFDKRIGMNVYEKSEYYVGEFVIEHDEGSPWATLSEDMRRQSLAQYTKLVEHEITDDYEVLTYKVILGDLCAYSVKGFEVEYKVRLQKGTDMIFFDTDVMWDVQSYRLRIAFPTSADGRNIYEIPYGYIERKPYKPDIVFEDNSSNWASAAGDWPAINWAGVEGKNFSAVLFNKGTPSYQINEDKNGVQNIYLTVLRAPTMGTYLNDAGAYSMTDYEGMRDKGNHHFSYAIKSYANDFKSNTAVKDGFFYNREAVTVMGDICEFVLPELKAENARIAAIKKAQKSDMILVRIAEINGIKSETEFVLPSNIKKVFETDLNENIIKEHIITNSKVSFELKPFKIKTFAFEY